MSNQKSELTVESVTQVIQDGKLSSLTQVSKALGLGKGSVSGSVSKRLREILPTIDEMLVANKANNGADPKSDTKVKPAKPAKIKPVKVAKPAKVNPAKSAKVPIKAGKWPRDKRNVFRAGSSYGIAFDILAFHKSGIEKEKWLELLAEATGKDVKHAGYDAQVLLSAKPNENGLSNNDSPRHRSCRSGFWIQRTNGHVKLIFD